MTVVYKMLGFRPGLEMDDFFSVDRGHPHVFLETEATSEQEPEDSPSWILPAGAPFAFAKAKDGWIDAVVRASELTPENVKAVLAAINNCSSDEVELQLPKAPNVSL